MLIVQEAIQTTVLEELRLADKSKQESIAAQQFSAAIMRPGSLSRPALMRALVTQHVPADADEIASQSLPELQALLAKVCCNTCLWSNA